MPAAIEALAEACRQRAASPAAARAFERAFAELRSQVATLADRRTRELQAKVDRASTALELRRGALLLTELDACHTALKRLE
jgi:hypothetical protein